MARRKRLRFLSVYLDPKTGRERCGSGADSQCHHYYANPQNVVKFGLRHPAFPPGQYHIYSWPEGVPCPEKPIMTAYKRVSYAAQS